MKKSKAGAWGSPKTKNIYIEGDNLESLKALKLNNQGEIDMIYIDPPYNTGKKFTYNDSFDCGDIEWGDFMRDRLEVARELLTSDGVIFITINTDSLTRLKAICDNVFNEKNFITLFVWEKSQHFVRSKKNFYSNCDFILCYGKELHDKGRLKRLLVERVEKGLAVAPLYNRNNKVSEITFPPGVINFRLEDGVYSSSEGENVELVSPVEVEHGVNKNELIVKTRSRWGQKRILEEIERGTKFNVKRESFSISVSYPSTRNTLRSPKQLLGTGKKNKGRAKSRFGENVGVNKDGSAELTQLLGRDIFSYPKPTSLIKYLTSMLFDEAKGEHRAGFTVLDFFSGSATTAQAVLELNKEDGGDRSFILIQSEESTPGRSEARKKGFNKITEIGQERVKQAIKKLVGDSGEELGFKVYKIK